MTRFKDAKRAEDDMIEAFRILEEEQTSIEEDFTRIGVNMKVARTRANGFAKPPLTP